MMGQLIDFCLLGGDEEFIGIIKYVAIWSNNRQKYKFSFYKLPLKLASNYYLLDNLYFTLDSMCLRQMIGILCGLTQLQLWKTFSCISIILDLQRARIFSNIFRFTDDLCTFNNNHFKNNYTDICSDGPELKK